MKSTLWRSLLVLQENGASYEKESIFISTEFNLLFKPQVRCNFEEFVPVIPLCTAGEENKLTLLSCIQ